MRGRRQNRNYGLLHAGGHPDGYLRFLAREEQLDVRPQHMTHVPDDQTRPPATFAEWRAGRGCHPVACNAANTGVRRSA